METRVFGLVYDAHPAATKLSGDVEMSEGKSDERVSARHSDGILDWFAARGKPRVSVSRSRQSTLDVHSATHRFDRIFVALSLTEGTKHAECWYQRIQS